MSDIKSNTDSLQFYLLKKHNETSKERLKTHQQILQSKILIYKISVYSESLVAVSTNQILMQIGFSLAKHVLFFARPLQELL